MHGIGSTKNPYDSLSIGPDESGIPSGGLEGISSQEGMEGGEVSNDVICKNSEGGMEQGTLVSGGENTSIVQMKNGTEQKINNCDITRVGDSVTVGKQDVLFKGFDEEGHAKLEMFAGKISTEDGYKEIALDPEQMTADLSELKHAPKHDCVIMKDGKMQGGELVGDPHEDGSRDVRVNGETATYQSNELMGREIPVRQKDGTFQMENLSARTTSSDGKVFDIAVGGSAEQAPREVKNKDVLCKGADVQVKQKNGSFKPGTFEGVNKEGKLEVAMRDGSTHVSDGSDIKKSLSMKDHTTTLMHGANTAGSKVTEYLKKFNDSEIGKQMTAGAKKGLSEFGQNAIRNAPAVAGMAMSAGIMAFLSLICAILFPFSIGALGKMNEQFAKDISAQLDKTVAANRKAAQRPKDDDDEMAKVNKQLDKKEAAAKKADSAAEPAKKEEAVEEKPVEAREPAAAVPDDNTQIEDQPPLPDHAAQTTDTVALSVLSSEDNTASQVEASAT